MTLVDFYEVAGYLANPSRLTHIEIEIPQNRLIRYSAIYQLTTGVAFPTIPNDAVYVIPQGGNKWGREMRIYLHVTDQNSIPNELKQISTIAGRPGYDQYNLRVNNKELIDELFEHGFLLNSPQNEARIRATIPAINLTDFNRGYNFL